MRYTLMLAKDINTLHTARNLEFVDDEDAIDTGKVLQSFMVVDMLLYVPSPWR